MTVEVQVKDMLEAGVHFGHQTRRWNPKMRPYIFAARDGIHIIDLDQTASLARDAYKFVADTVALGNSILFVGTKKQAKDVVESEAKRVGQFYVSNRWLGGMLTNFRTIRQSIDRLNDLVEKREKGELEKLTKKEALQIEREIEKLEFSLGGIKMMKKIPGAVFLIDPSSEIIAKKEANKLGIPTEETVLLPYDLATADEMFFTSTPYCIMPSTKFNNLPVGDGRVGPVTRRLLEAWSELVGLDIAAQAQAQIN